MKKRKILLDELWVRIYADKTIKIDGLDDNKQRTEILKALRRILQKMKKSK